MKGKTMNTKSVMKLIIIIIAVTLMIVPVLASCARPEPAPKPETESETETDTATTAAPNKSPKAGDSSSNQTAAQTSTVSAGGAVIRSQIQGEYSVRGFQGFAVRMSDDAIRALAGISGTPFVRAYDITAKSDPEDFACFNAAAASEGATVLGAVKVDLGQMNNGMFSSLPNRISVPATLGVNAAGGRTLAVVRVFPGGATEILPDTDDNAQTVTFNITGGPASYAVIAY